MNCAAVTALLPDYIRRRLPGDQEAVVRAHLSACPVCAAAYEEELAFGALVHGTDAPAPAFLMAQVMASVRAEPRQMPVFRVRALDFALAFGASGALLGIVFGLLALRSVSPLLADFFDLRTLLAGGLTTRVLTVAALWIAVGLAVSVPLAGATHAVLRTRRPTITRQSPLG